MRRRPKARKRARRMARLSCGCRIGGGAGVPIVVFGDGGCVAHIEIFGDARVVAVGGCILGGKQQPHQA